MSGELLKKVSGVNYTEIAKSSLLPRINEADKIYQFNTLAEVFEYSAPVADVVTFSEDNATYIFASGMDWGVTELVITGGGVVVTSYNVNKAVLLSSTTGTFITCNKSVYFSNIAVIGVAGGACGICADDSLTDTITFDTMAVQGFVTNAYVKDYRAFVTKNVVGISSCTNGIVVEGTVDTLTIKTVLFETVSGYCVNLSGATLSAVDIDRNVCYSIATTTFIKVSPNNGNFTGNGFGTIRANKIIGDLAGIGSEGYSAVDEKWEVILNNIIKDSDRLRAQGFSHHIDGNTGTLSVDDTGWTQLTIDGATLSKEDGLPNILLGTSPQEHLWQTSDNTLRAIAENDTFLNRMDLTIDSLSGNPTRLNIYLDIQGSSPANILGDAVIKSSITLKTGNNQAHSKEMSYYTGATFLANGGRIWLRTDSGSVVIGSRAIVTQRTSSGARI